MQWLKDLFSDGEHPSMMRVMSLICVVAACVIAIYAIYKDKDISATSVLCGVFLGVGITGKVVQSGIETKDGK